MVSEVQRENFTDNLPSERLYDLKGMQRDILPKSKTWVYKEVQEGRFPPPIKLGRSSLWAKSWLDAWVQAAKNGIISEFMQEHLASRKDLK